MTQKHRIMYVGLASQGSCSHVIVCVSKPFSLCIKHNFVRVSKNICGLVYKIIKTPPSYKWPHSMDKIIIQEVVEPHLTVTTKPILYLCHLWFV